MGIGLIVFLIVPLIFQGATESCCTSKDPWPVRLLNSDFLFQWLLLRNQYFLSDRQPPQFHRTQTAPPHRQKICSTAAGSTYPRRLGPYS